VVYGMANEIIAQVAASFSGTLVYGAIALVALVGVFKCIYPVFRNGALLNRAVTKLERSAAGNERPIWREARFLGRALRPDWQRFLLNAGQLDLRGMPCNTQEYINEDTVIYKPGHAQLAELIPGLLTSLGILGTFLGLMEGLTDLDLADAAKTISSIPTLLGGMKFAFATSVAGISCSLVFNMINRMAVGHAFKALDSFDEAFYELAMPRPLDADVQMICQKQDDEMNLRRAADQISSQMAGAVEMAVSRAVHPLTMSLDNFLQGTSRDQADGMRRIVDQFVTQMNISLGEQFSVLAETLAEEAKRARQSGGKAAETDVQAKRQDELIRLLKETAEQQAAVARETGRTQEEILAALQALNNRTAGTGARPENAEGAQKDGAPRTKGKDPVLTEMTEGA